MCYLTPAVWKDRRSVSRCNEREGKGREEGLSSLLSYLIDTQTDKRVTAQLLTVEAAGGNADDSQT